MLMGSAKFELYVFLSTCSGPYLTIMAPHLTAEHDDRDVEDSLLVAFADALYYNAALTLRALSELGSLAKFMSKLGAAVGDTRENGTMRHFPSKRDKKIVILGLTSVLTVPSQALPPEVAGSLAQVSFGVLQVLLALKAQEEKGHGGSDASSSSDGLSKLTAGGDHYEAEEGSDDEDVDPEEIERLMREAARRAGHGDEDEDEWDSEVEWDSDDEDAEVASPIDAISPFVFFAEALQAVQSSDPGRFTTLVANFDAATQTAVQGMMAYAVELKAAQAAAAAAAAQGNGQ